jgi:hypothetical protein
VDLRNSGPFIQDKLWLGERHEYAVIVDLDGMPIAARRALDGGDWETVDLSRIAGNPLDAPTIDDRHNVYSIAEGPDGRSDGQSAYLNRIAYDTDDDIIHIVFTWRLSPDAGTNSDVGHAMSADGGRSWTTIDGKPLASPLRHDEHSTIVDTADVGTGLVNSAGLVLDAGGRPHAAFLRDGEHPSLLVVRHDGARWHEEAVDWPNSGRPAVVIDPEGRTWALGRRGASIVGIDLADPSRDLRMPQARLPSGWEIAIDSRSMEVAGIVRTLVPDVDTPRIVEIFS